MIALPEQGRHIEVMMAESGTSRVVDAYQQP